MVLTGSMAAPWRSRHALDVAEPRRGLTDRRRHSLACVPKPVGLLAEKRYRNFSAFAPGSSVGRSAYVSRAPNMLVANDRVLVVRTDARNQIAIAMLAGLRHVVEARVVHDVGRDPGAPPTSCC